MYVVDREAVELRRRAPIWSFAYWIHVLFVLALWILPFFIAFCTSGFWIKEGSYYERPDISFRHSMAITCSTSSGVSFSYSTSSQWNSLQHENTLRIPAIKAREVDLDHDALIDEFRATVSMPLASTEVVNHVYAVFLFQLDLTDSVWVSMEAPVFIDESFPAGASHLDVSGSLQFHQLKPLSTYDTRDVYNTTILDDVTCTQNATIGALMLRNLDRNETVRLDPKYAYWSNSGPSNLSPITDQFTFSLLIKIPPLHIMYQPGFFETMKFGWVQYISVLWLVWGIIHVVRGFIYRNNFVTTAVAPPPWTTTTKTKIF